MRSCQLFSVAVVALTFLGMTGCAAPVAKTLQGDTGASSPITSAAHAPAAGYAKRAK